MGVEWPWLGQLGSAPGCPWPSWVSDQISECQPLTPMNRAFEAGPTQPNSQPLNPRICLVLFLAVVGQPFPRTQQVPKFPASRGRLTCQPSDSGSTVGLFRWSKSLMTSASNPGMCPKAPSSPLVGRQRGGAPVTWGLWHEGPLARTASLIPAAALHHPSSGDMWPQGVNRVLAAGVCGTQCVWYGARRGGNLWRRSLATTVPRPDVWSAAQP